MINRFYYFIKILDKTFLNYNEREAPLPLRVYVHARYRSAERQRCLRSFPA